VGVWFKILRGIFRLQRLCFARQKLVLALTVFIVGLVGYGLMDIKTSNDPFLLFGPGNTYRQKLERKTRRLGKPTKP